MANLNQAACGDAKLTQRCTAVAGKQRISQQNPWLDYRPRGTLARAVHARMLQDQYLRVFDKNEWYRCNLSSLNSDLRGKFVQLRPDEETLKFLDESEKKSNWIFTQIWHMLVKLFLGLFMTQTSINGWLQRGSMFVISQPQLLELLKIGTVPKYDSLLDLGAGDGKVTAHLAPLFRKVFVTEVSSTMRTLLRQQNFRILNIHDWYRDRKFSVISCLNLIDRCDTPLDLLKQIRDSTDSDGFVLLAVVLPFYAYVESGSSDHKPRQLLPITGNTFEAQVQSFVEDVLKPAGFAVHSWSRVPYLCEGDLHQSYYWLDDAIFALTLA